MALTFDGVDDYVYLNPYAAARTFPNGIGSGSLWFKPTSGFNNLEVIFELGTVTPRYSSMQLSFDQRTINTARRSRLSLNLFGGSAGITTPDGIVTLNKWNFFGYTFSNTGTSIFVNSLKYTGTLPSLINPGATSLWTIGHQVGANGTLAFTGEIAEFGLWPGIELNDSEFLSLWKGSPPSNVRADKLTMSLPMETVTLLETPNIPPISSKLQGQNVGTLKSNGHPPVVVGIPEM